MPLYVYVCENCENEFEISQSIKDEPLIHCSMCDTDSLYKSMQPCFIHGEPTTLGQLAERNTKKASKEKLAKIREEHKSMGKKAKKQMYEDAGITHVDNELYNKLNKATKEEKQRFVKDGII